MMGKAKPNIPAENWKGRLGGKKTNMNQEKATPFGVGPGAPVLAAPVETVPVSPVVAVTTPVVTPIVKVSKSKSPVDIMMRSASEPVTPTPDNVQHQDDVPHIERSVSDPLPAGYVPMRGEFYHLNAPNWFPCGNAFPRGGVFSILNYREGYHLGRVSLDLENELSESESETTTTGPGEEWESSEDLEYHHHEYDINIQIYHATTLPEVQEVQVGGKLLKVPEIQIEEVAQVEVQEVQVGGKLLKVPEIQIEEVAQVEVQEVGLMLLKVPSQSPKTSSKLSPRPSSSPKTTRYVSAASTLSQHQALSRASTSSSSRLGSGSPKSLRPSSSRSMKSIVSNSNAAFPSHLIRTISEDTFLERDSL